MMDEILAAMSPATREKTIRGYYRLWTEGRCPDAEMRQLAIALDKKEAWDAFMDCQISTGDFYLKLLESV